MSSHGSQLGQSQSCEEEEEQERGEEDSGNATALLWWNRNNTTFSVQHSRFELGCNWRDITLQLLQTPGCSQRKRHEM